MTLTTLQIVADEDDGYFYNRWIYNEGHIEVGGGGVASEHGVFRWRRNLNIPPKATIISAFLEVFPHITTPYEDVKTKLVGIAEANTPDFLTDPMPRPETSAEVIWNLPAFNEMRWYQSPNLKEIFQEIVNLSDYRQGNPLALKWKDNGSLPYRKCEIRDYHSRPDYSAVLVIEWTSIVTHTLRIESVPISVPVTLDGTPVGDTPTPPTDYDEGQHIVEYSPEVTT